MTKIESVTWTTWVLAGLTFFLAFLYMINEYEEVQKALEHGYDQQVVEGEVIWVKPVK